MLLAQTLTTDTAPADAAQTLRQVQHVAFAYGVAILLLWGYALRIWLAGRALKKREGRAGD